MGRNRQHKTPHIMIVLKKRFNGKTGDRWHLLPILDVTMTKIPVSPWFSRGLDRRANVYKRQSGWYFVISGGKGANLCDYNHLFNIYLTRTKNQTPGIISEKVDLENDTSLWKSVRIGSI